MRILLGKLIDALRGWMRSNAEAHARATPTACCSRPPAGAGTNSERRGDGAGPV